MMCTHVAHIRIEQPIGSGCEDCMRMGDTWSQLRMCIECGYVGCCDSSKNKHAIFAPRSIRSRNRSRAERNGLGATSMNFGSKNCLFRNQTREICFGWCALTVSTTYASSRRLLPASIPDRANPDYRTANHAAVPRYSAIAIFPKAQHVIVA